LPTIRPGLLIGFASGFHGSYPETGSKACGFSHGPFFLIAVMTYACTGVSTVVRLRAEDYVLLKERS
jgi:hypothetical protein